MSEEIKEAVKIEVAPDSGETERSIGNYRVLRLLGKGGMGAVYEVEHKLLKRKFALKILSPDRIPDETMIERFRAEAQAVSGLEHPGLLRIFEFGISDQGQPFFVTDLFEGKPLSEVVRENGPLDTPSVAQLMMQTATALAHAHEKGVVHRDIKPSNILMKQDHGSIEAKIIDFGIAKQQANADGEAPPTLTATGELIGTPQYMSPEQCQGVRLDARSDIYSLGCVFYQTLTGSPPFTSDNFMHLMVQHMQEAPKEIRTTDKVRRSLVAVTMRCLAKDRDRRFQTMSELIADLNAIAGGATLKPRRHAPSGIKQRLKIYIPIAITASILAFAAAAYEIWAPQVVLYMNIPLMDRNKAETVVALREANRLRIEGKNSDGSINSQKYQLAESLLAPYAGTQHDWNVDAAHKLATFYAIEGKQQELNQVLDHVAGNDALARAYAMHNVGAATEQAKAYEQAYPLQEQAYATFLQKLGAKHMWTVRELCNLAMTDWDLHNYARAARELKEALPNLKYWDASKESQIRGYIKELEDYQKQSGPPSGPPAN